MMGRPLALLGVLGLLLLPNLSGADERILDYRSDIQIQPDGRLEITETIRVRSEGRHIQRGIYRDFPTHYRDRLGNHVKVEFIPIAVRRNGSNEAWHTEERVNGTRIYAGSPNRMLEAGVHEYDLVFETDRQLGFFEDHDELYFNIIGTGWIFPIDHAVATIRLPFEVDAGALALDSHTGAYGSTSTMAVAEVLASNRVRFETTRPLQPREGLTIAVAWPKGLISEPSGGQRIGWFLTDNGAALVLLLGLLAPLGWYLWAWNLVGRDPERGVIIPRFKPPEGLSPAACRYVGDMSFNRNSFTAAIISLAVKGQLTIGEDDAEFTLQRTADAPESTLSGGERAVLDSLLPQPGSSIEMDNENYKDFQAARKALRKELKKEYLGRLFHQNGIYLLPPVLMSIAAAIIAFFFDGGPAVWVTYACLTMGLHGLFNLLMRAPTPAGRLIVDEIEGFKTYLDTAEQDRLDRMRSPELTPDVFESFLPYAYALGVENSWCRRFASELPEEIRRQAGYQPTWYSGRLHGMDALHHLGDDFGSSFSSAISSASSPPGSTSGSGGGGFSGGGGGGGGGGGW